MTTELLVLSTICAFAFLLVTFRRATMKRAAHGAYITVVRIVMYASGFVGLLCFLVAFVCHGIEDSEP